MKKTLIAGLVIFFFFSAKAQKTIVLDSITSEILPFASISYQKIDGKNIVRVSNIGYQTKTLKSYTYGDSILLSPITYNLKEVEINAEKKRAKYYDLGYHKEKRIFYNTFSKPAIPYRLLAASKIFAKNNSDLIEGVYLRLRYKNEQSEFKLYIMSVGSEGFPNDTIQKKVLDAKDYNRKAYVDISDHHLNIPPEGIFIVFEWPVLNYDYSRRKLSIVTTTKYEVNSSYLFHHERWQPYYNEESSYQNFAFGFKMRKH